jgi:hypothetical protein
MMNHVERFRAVMGFQPVDRFPRPLMDIQRQVYAFYD